MTSARRPDLRIAFVSTYGGHAGGAAVAMHRLAAAVEAEGPRVGIVARHWPGHSESPPAVATAAGSERLERRIRRRIRHGRTPVSNTLFSTDWPAWDVATHPAVIAADVVHVHWVAGFLDAEAVRRIILTGKPVVWTQHDLRAFTGGCHYAAGCQGFVDGCRGCLQLVPRLHAVPERTLRRSRRLLRGQPLCFVAPSRWLAGELARSSLFDADHHALHVIPNGIDLERYAPAADRRAARARLGLPAAGLAVILGSMTLAERRKGAAQAVAALALLAERLQAAGGPPPVVVTYGDGSVSIRGLVHRQLGPLDEPGVIAALHGCDVHLTMTREDNLPNTVVEALACGLPVVGSAVGGMPDMVTSGVEGWLVPRDDPAAAAAALARLAADPALLAATAQAARRRAVAAFDARLQGRRHLAVYRDLLAQPQRTGTPGHPFARPIGMTPAAAALLAPPAGPRRGLRGLRRLLRRAAALPSLRRSPR